MKLRDHPRLYITSSHYDRLQAKSDHPIGKASAKRIRKMAQEFVADPSIIVDKTGHNYHLIRARKMQTRVLTTLTEYRRTGNRQYRDTILADVRRIAEWEYWSWITWRKKDSSPEAIFDLSYGENSTTLALAFDGLRQELTEEEVALFVATARKRSFKPFLKRNGGKKKEGYFGHPHTNWNTVTTGGAGMLALAMGDLCPESEEIVRLAEESVAPFFKSLKGDGGWPEGVGYWNYGMRYGFMYLLSHEQATGRKHPLMKLKGTEATLLFPLQFSPNGLPCSFGDVNRFSPLPFHYAAAERFGRQDISAELDRRLEKRTREGLDGPWPDSAELLLFHPGRTKKIRRWPSTLLVKGLEWGYLADRMPGPSLYISVRGGTTDAPHVHRDLMSFFCVVEDEKLVENIPVDDYLDTTFSSRRYELYETAAASKNTIFINGVGIADKVSVKTSTIKKPGFEGFRMDATDAMGGMRDASVANFCGRVILLVKKKGVLIIDRVEVPFAALVESRLHTFCDVTMGKSDARIKGRKQRMDISFASSAPTLLKPGMGLQTHPQRDPDSVIRYVSERKVLEITSCYFLMPNGRAKVTIAERGKRSVVSISGDVTAKVGFETRGLRFG
jgi:hypothetical protein